MTIDRFEKLTPKIAVACLVRGDNDNDEDDDDGDDA